jgi:hypothetical protein
MPGKGSKRERLVSILKGKAKETSGQTSGTQARGNAIEAIPDAVASPSTGSVLLGTPRAPQQSGAVSPTTALETDLARPTADSTEDRKDLYGLKSLAGPTEDDAVLDPRLPDIIAVHGIDGNAWKTWEHSNGKLWLKDFLPKHVLGARIYSFGYPAEVAFTRGRGDLKGFARSLLEGLNGVRYNEVFLAYILSLVQRSLYCSNSKHVQLSSSVIVWEVSLLSRHESLIYILMFRD